MSQQINHADQGAVMSPETRPEAPAELQDPRLINRREAIRRVTMMLGGVALVGGNALLTGCRDGAAPSAGAAFTADEIAFLDEVADTMLPETSTPGARAAGVGPFMALMVTDTYDEQEQRIFREGMRRLDEASRETHGAAFMDATPAQRLALLERLDREQKQYMDHRSAAQARAREQAAGIASAVGSDSTADSTQADGYLPDQRQQNTVGADAAAAPAITADAPPHYFRMMKELALLGYFTSEIGYNQAMRYVETPGRFDPCVPYTPGEKAWAPHA